MNDSQKVVGIYFHEVNPEGNPFDQLHYRASYIDFLDELEKHGVKAVILRGKNTYKDHGIFTRHFTYNRDTDSWDEGGEIHVDVLYDKGRLFEYRGMEVVNPLELIEVSMNKWRTYQEFKEMQAETELVNSEDDLKRYLQSLGETMVVTKGLSGHGGDDVFIQPADEVLNFGMRDSDFPLLVQEFIDTSEGIPGIVEGVHDLRVTVLGEEVIDTYIRVPKKGSLKSNLHAGGTTIDLDFDQIPPEVIDMIEVIKKRFAHLTHKIYSLDFMRGNGGRWVLVEMNHNPGMPQRGNRRHSTEALKKIAQYLADIANQ